MRTLKRYADSIKRVGLVANVDKKSGAAQIRKAAAQIRKAGREVLTDAATAKMAGLRDETRETYSKVARESDLLLVFGGDGTMLRVTRDIAGCRTPILAINIGSLGFLTAVPSDETAAALKLVWEGRFDIDSRNLIEASPLRGGATPAQHALNEFVISRGAASRMIELDVAVDDVALTTYRCDGLIVSSPTGSTAYSLSAGGAIVSPSAEVFTITPICPHTLSNRSVLVSLSSSVRVKVLNHKPETIMASDGQVTGKLSFGDEIVIRRSRRIVKLLRLEGTSFFKTLNQKLNWSGSNV
ncbi:MAG: NAD+ kinase [Candidatus Binatia bacterium]